MTAGASASLAEVRRIVLRALEGRKAQVFLFGSFARGDESRVSDIDVAVLPADPLPAGLLFLIQEELENSLSLYPVDLVDLSETSAAFRERVLKEGVQWTD